MRKLLFTCFCFAIILTGYSQNENAIIEGGELILKPNIPTNPVAGTICWTGTDFKGFNGVEWISLTGVEAVDSIAPIEIGDYLFQFPSEFSLVPGQGTDSYIGNINGTDISLSFDYGWYTGPSSNLPEDEYIVTEDEIEGHFRQIVKPIDSQNNYTKIYMYKISDQVDSPYGYNRLTMSVKNITSAQQDLIISVFSNVEITD